MNKNRKILIWYIVIFLIVVIQTCQYSNRKPVDMTGGIRRYWIPSETSTGTYERTLPPNQN